MGTLTGNPHADAAQPVYSSHQTHEQVQESLVYTQREATLALAFEQRTLALIAYAQVADDETADRLWVDHITPRLGLEGGNDD